MSFTSPSSAFADAFADLPLLDSEPVPPRIAAALDALRAGRAVVLQDDHDRENEADLIVAAERITPETMALLIRECSGIVCLCLTDEKVRALELPPMVQTNESRNGTAFTVSIEAREGVHTGVSAADDHVGRERAQQRPERHVEVAVIFGQQPVQHADACIDRRECAEPQRDTADAERTHGLPGQAGARAEVDARDEEFVDGDRADDRQTRNDRAARAVECGRVARDPQCEKAGGDAEQAGAKRGRRARRAVADSGDVIERGIHGILVWMMPAPPSGRCRQAPGHWNDWSPDA